MRDLDYYMRDRGNEEEAEAGKYMQISERNMPNDVMLRHMVHTFPPMPSLRQATGIIEMQFAAIFCLSSLRFEGLKLTKEFRVWCKAKALQNWPCISI